jgi:signal transduction histidine kinase
MSLRLAKNPASSGWRCLCLIWLLLLTLPAFAGPTSLNAQWQVFVDSSSLMQPLELLAPKVAWQADTRQGMNGYKPGVFWAQFQVPAVIPGQDGLLLSVGYPYLDKIDVYVWGQSAPFASAGDTRPSPAPLLSYANHVIRLPTLPTEQRYLLRVQTTSALNVKAQLLSQEDLLQSQSTGQFRAGAFVTLYLLSALMYVVGAIVMRQSVQLAYALYLLCLLAIFVGVSQPILLNAWLGTPRWANWITGFGILFIPASGLLLWTVILRLRNNRPRLFKVYMGLVVYCAASLFSINTPWYGQAAQLSVLGILFISAFNLGLAGWTMRDPTQRKALGLFILAFLLSTLSAIANNLSVVGAIAARPWFAAAFDASSLVHVLLFAVATNLAIRKLEADNKEGQFQHRLLTQQRDQVQSFSSFVAHELLNPMARIGRSAEMLARETALEAKPARRVADIRIWAFETGKLVEAFLNSASLKSGQALVKPTQVNLAAWLHDIQTELTLNYPQVELLWKVDAPAIGATFDPLLAKVALENIIINCLKYAGTSNAVTIAVSVRNGVAVFAVNDLGPGLKPEQYAHIGQAVLLREPNQEKPGFGLGLSLVAHIAQAHGGAFSAQPGQPCGVRWELCLGKI